MLLEKPKRERGFKKERILRVLLNHTDEDITKYRVAKLAEVSEPWCREVTERLENKGLLQDTAVVKPRDLYEEWQSTRIEPNQLTVSIQQPMPVLNDINLKYGLTTYQAENLHQGFLFVSSTDFYVELGEIEDWQEIVKEKGLLGGGNTRLRATDKHVFYNSQTVDGFTTVSVPQLIVDLLDEGGPCEEAAEKLIQKYHGAE
jgi:DNA-binding Lrp family transcriptional regulator